MTSQLAFLVKSADRGGASEFPFSSTKQSNDEIVSVHNMTQSEKRYPVNYHHSFVKHIIFILVIFEVLQVTHSEMNSLWNFSWVRENEVAASSAPENSEHLKWLQSQGIKHVLCLDEVSVSN